MGLLDILIGQGIKTFGNVIYNNSKNIPPRGTVHENNRIVSDGKRWVTGLEAQKILEEQKNKLKSYYDPITKSYYDKPVQRHSREELENIVFKRNNNQQTPEVTAPKYVIARGFDRNKMQPDPGVGPITIPSVEQPNLEQPNLEEPNVLASNLLRLNINPTYNKKQTRQWLRQQGINPYALSGADRRNIRAQLNNNSVEVVQPPTPRYEELPNYAQMGQDILNGWRTFTSQYLPSSRKGSRLIKMQDPVTKFKYKNGGSLNRIPFIQEELTKKV